MSKSRFWPPVSICAALGMFAACVQPQGQVPDPKEAGRDLHQPIDSYVAHTEEHFGIPTFAWIGERPAVAPGAGPEAVAAGTLRGLAGTHRLSEATLATASLRALHDSGSGAIIAQFEQKVEGIEVFRAGMSIAMTRDLRPVSASGFLAPRVVPRSRDFGGGARAAVVAAYKEMTTQDLGPGSLTPAGATEGGYETFALPEVVRGEARLVSPTPARTRKVWFPETYGLRPAYYVEVNVGRADQVDSDMFAYVIGADTGEVLFRKDLTAADSYSYRVWADTSGNFTPYDNPNGNDYTPYPAAMPDGSDPMLRPANLVMLANVPFSKNDPWLPPNAQELRGNNAWTFADIVPPDGFNMGDVKVGPTSPGVFDRAYDPTTQPEGSNRSIQAITTNLFFIINSMHDNFYDAGYDEKSFNAQQDNYGRGGLGGDPVEGEAQDYSGRNNANAMTPADGAMPRIRMYLWDNVSHQLKVNSPADIAATDQPGSAQFGPTDFMLTGNTVLVDDGGATPTLGCTGPFKNAAAVLGNIAVIDRGACPFAQKAYNAQISGAKGVIIVNNVAGPAPGMAGAATPMPVVIPVQSLSMDDGGKIKTKLTGGMAVSVTLTSKRLNDRDGSLDATIVSHEWGHTLSNRLIGNGSGIGGLQALGMGEGWSDFTAMTTIVRPEDAMVAANAGWKGTWAVGAYAVSTPGTDAFYYGIRRYPYTTDKTKNPLTFKHIQEGTALPTMPVPRFGASGVGNSEVHNTGEIWGNMLWGCFAGILNSGRYTVDQAQKTMRKYLVAGYKLTPHTPTILEARDALLAAIVANEPKDYTLCWQAFADRGAGVGAVGPPRDTADNTGVTESFVVGTDLAFVSATVDDSVKSCDNDGVLDNDESGKLTITVRSTGTQPLTGTMVTVSSSDPAISFPSGATATFPMTQPFQTGKVAINVAMKNAAPIDKFTLSLSFSDANLAVPRMIKQDVIMFGNYDDVPKSSTTDTVDAATTVWSVSGDAMQDGSVMWTRPFDNGDGYWHIDDNPAPSDQYLVSPDLPVDPNAKFVLTFKHRWSFESSNGQNQDGGVIEISADGGTSWTDVGPQLPTNGYTGTIYMGNKTLMGRKAFTGTSPGYPSYVSTTLDLGQMYKGKTVKLRFRMATDDGTGLLGWDVDELAFAGITSKPFSGRVGNQGMCPHQPPIANAGPDQTVAPGAMVTLMGSGMDPDGESVTFHWTQSGGQMLSLSEVQVPQPSFTAPDVTDLTMLSFTLVVNDAKVNSAPSTVHITVDPSLKPMPMPMPGGCGCRVAAGDTTMDTAMPGAALLLGLGLVLLGRRRRRG